GEGMMDWITKEISISLWQLLTIAVYVVTAHSYVTYRLARSDELDKIWLKLKRVISVLPLPMKPNQNQRVDNKINYPHSDIDGRLRDVESLQNQINDNPQQKSPNEPSHKPFHGVTLPQGKKAKQPNANKTLL
ncbi:MAG: hypothetical protein ABID87_01060, partial [Chloroflexota bacterium]